MVKIVVNGASQLDDVPGLSELDGAHNLVAAGDEAALAAALPGTEVLLGWNFRGRDLENCWAHADTLKWIHWCGAGVDAVLFPELTESDVVLTNARGLFDRAMAEYVLGLMLAHAKGFDELYASRAKRAWYYRMTECIAGTRAVIFGVGSIGREVASVLRGVGIEVTGIGRSARSGVPVFGKVHAADDAGSLLAAADWVIGVLPDTAETHGYFDAAFFARMKPTARFYNIGRGTAVDEAALIAALEARTIAGAGLDVFANEPLAQDDPLWAAPNLIISPHISGDFIGHREAMVEQFIGNLERYLRGGDLFNVVDKQAGYVRD